MEPTPALAVTYGGWVEYYGGGGSTWARFEDVDGRLLPMDLVVARDRGVTRTDLRDLPIDRFEAWVNAPDVAQRVRSRLAARPDRQTAILTGAQVVADVILQRSQDAIPLQELMTDTPEIKIDVPAARPYGDEFYAQVAVIYSSLAARERAPAPLIAEANSVPVSTVHRWIREARRRGYLARGVPGRAG